MHQRPPSIPPSQCWSTSQTMGLTLANAFTGRASLLCTALHMWLPCVDHWQGCIRTSHMARPRHQTMFLAADEINIESPVIDKQLHLKPQLVQKGNSDSNDENQTQPYAQDRALLQATAIRMNVCASLTAKACLAWSLVVGLIILSGVCPTRSANRSA